MIPLDTADGLNTCIGCGCDDVHACLVDGMPCSWLRLDPEARAGVCSGCKDDVDRYDAGDRTREVSNATA